MVAKSFHLNAGYLDLGRFALTKRIVLCAKKKV